MTSAEKGSVDYMRTTALAVAMALLAAAQFARAEEGEILASLRAAQTQNDDAYPYRTAELNVENRFERVVRTVSLQWRQGGPLMVHPVAIGPGTQQTLLVNLPAASPQQTYRVAFYESQRRREALAWHDLDITWPVAVTTGAAFVDCEAYRPYGDDRATWPAPLRKNVLLTAGILSLALAAVLFLRRPALRQGAVALIVLVGAGSAAAMMARQDVAVQRIESGADLPVYAASDRSTVHVVTARRATRWRHASPDLAPVYRSRQELADDTTVVHARDGLSAVLTPDRPRLFRRNR